MSFYRKVTNRLLLWRNRLQPVRTRYRPKDYVVAAASAAKEGAGVVYHPLSVAQAHLPVRADLFARLSPYFSYDTINRIGTEPVLSAEYPYSVVEVMGGRIYTDNLNTIAILTRDGTLLGDISYQYSPSHEAAAYQNEALRMRRWPEPRHIKGTVLSLLAGGGSTNNYGHWLIDTLPRLEFIRRTGLLDQVDFFLVPATRFDYQRDSLALLGIPTDRIITAHQGLHLTADRLIATAHPRGNRHYVLPDWIMDWNRSQFIEPALAQTAGKTYSPYIYITRRDTRIRNVVNEEEVIDFLRRRGFEAYTMAELPFVEKIALFAQARAIVSVSGAGLNNLMFASAGAAFVEIFPPGLVHTQYYQMGRYNGLSYEYFICDNARGPATDMQTGRAEDVRIDLAILGAALDAHPATAPVRA